MTANGIYFRYPRGEYNQLDRVNFSTLKHIGRSPAHYLHAKMEGRTDTDALKLGRADHIAVLEPTRFLTECVEWTGGRRASRAWDAFEEEHKHQEILTTDEWAHSLALQRAVRGSVMAAPYLANGKSEATICWSHVSPKIGALDGYEFQCKGRVDFITANALVDLKTARDVSPDKFGKDIYNFGYHIQAALYSDGYFAVTGERKPYVIVAAEKDAPYVVQVYRITDDMLAIGRERYRSFLDLLNVCTESNHWPGYSANELDAELPRWAIPPPDEDASGLDLDFTAAQGA